MPARARRLAIFFGPAQVLQWNGTNWSALPQSLNPSGDTGIFALAFKNDTLFAGGLFTSAGTAVVDNIAAWDGQNWNAVNNALGGNDVFAVATQGTNVYLAGDFTSAAGTRVGAIVRWDGIHWWPLGGGSTNGVNQTVYALAASTFGPLYAAGNFSQAGGVAVNNIAQWDGTNWTPLGTGTTNGLNGTVYSLLLDSAGELVVGGSFAQAGGVAATNIAIWDGHAWSALAGGVNGHVLALAASGTDLYAGGAFTSAGGVSVNNVAYWDGSSWSALGNGIGSSSPQVIVQALAVRGPQIFAGAGIEASGAGRSLPWVAQWDGSTWTTIATNLYKLGNITAVNALVVIGNDLYAGGLFATINSLNTGSIARWDGTNWFPLGTGVEGDSPTVYALAAQGNELLAGGSFSIAGVKPSTLFARWLLPDVPPIVAMTSPTPNSIFTVGANLDLNVDASDTNDPVSQVAYYAGPTLIGVSSTPPYSFTWSNVFTGDYTLYAAATDGSGQTTFSAPVPITVVPPTNDIPPSIHFISPTNNSLFTTGENIALQVDASDSDGSVRQVAFYDNSTLIGLVTNAPYSIAWSSDGVGNYTLLAVAMDNLGATNTASVQISLESPPYVYVDDPADGARYIAPSYIYLEANANIDVGTIARVDFYTNGAFFVSANIAQSPEYAYRWNNPPLGNYSLTALAVDGHGFSTLSIPVQFSVVASNTPLISITTPPAGAVYSAPTNILVAVSVSDSYPIQSVQLYNNGVLFGTLTNAPYVFVLRNLTQTTYNFVADALDTQGYSGASLQVSVSVTNDPAREPLFNLTDLGALLGPMNQALGLNGYGLVVGGSTTPTTSEQPFFDNNGVVQWLPLFGGESLGGGGYATGINNSNVITGSAETGSGYGHAFSFDGTNLVDLGTFGGQQSSGAAINASGAIVGSADDANNEARAFLYANGKMTNLDTFGGANSVATAINTTGQVVGFAAFPPGAVIGFLYYPGASNQTLGNLGGPVCQPYAINDAGQIAGEAGTAAGYNHAFLSLQGFMVDLGTLGGFNSAALGMNNYGQIVGWSENDQLQDHAFLWQNDVMYDLNELIPTNSGWTLQYATAINDAGQIVGYGLNGSDENDQAFLLTLATNSPVQPQDSQLLAYIAGQFNLNLPVPLGSPFVLQASTNLQNWIPVATNYDRTGLVNFTDPHATATRFYRAVPFH
jgi:probable HAF family extracellular repeat protein